MSKFAYLHCMEHATLLARALGDWLCPCTDVFVEAPMQELETALLRGASPVAIPVRSWSVTYSEEDQAFIGTCPDFPSLSWCAKSHGEAMDGIRQLVADVEREMARPCSEERTL